MNPLSKIKLLIVDDNEELLDTHSGLFKSLGFHVATAANGQLALDILYAGDFDVVFTDIRMPIMDGVALLKAIRARDARSPSVIVTSGYSDYPADELYQLGANGFLAKPVNSQVIKNILSRALLHKEDLWANKMKLETKSQLTKRYHSFEDMLKQGEIKFGNGGFFISQFDPIDMARQHIRFSINFDQKSFISKLEGVGTIQWIQKENLLNRKKGMGIEFRYLEDQCRQKLSRWIESQNFIPFIPLR